MLTTLNVVNSNNRYVAQETLRRCIDDVILWNTENMLLYNRSKTEVIHLTSRFNKHHSPLQNLSLTS